MKIGFIGCGNMAKAIIDGAIISECFKKSDICAYDINREPLIKYCTASGINYESSLEILAGKCDILVLSIKPQVFPDVLPVLKDFSAEKLIISIAAGKTIDYIEGFLGKGRKIIRVMPNLNATVLEAMSAYCTSNSVSAEDEFIAKKLFDSIGKVIKIPEEDFSIFSAISGCSPAFSFMFIDALAKAGVKYGLDEKTALKCAVQAVKGSAVQLEKNKIEPDELVKRVCSPGGTTIEGVNSLNNDNLYQIVEKAVKASYEKDKKM